VWGGGAFVCCVCHVCVCVRACMHAPIRDFVLKCRCVHMFACARTSNKFFDALRVRSRVQAR